MSLVSATRLSIAPTGTEDIDLHFGWRLKEYKKLMRLHYSDRGKRTARSKVVKAM